MGPPNRLHHLNDVTCCCTWLFISFGILCSHIFVSNNSGKLQGWFAIFPVFFIFLYGLVKLRNDNEKKKQRLPSCSPVKVLLLRKRRRKRCICMPDSLHKVLSLSLQTWRTCLGSVESLFCSITPGSGSAVPEL